MAGEGELITEQAAAVAEADRVVVAPVEKEAETGTLINVEGQKLQQLESAERSHSEEQTYPLIAIEQKPLGDEEKRLILAAVETPYNPYRTEERKERHVNQPSGNQDGLVKRSIKRALSQWATWKSSQFNEWTETDISQAWAKLSKEEHAHAKSRRETMEMLNAAGEIFINTDPLRRENDPYAQQQKAFIRPDLQALPILARIRARVEKAKVHGLNKTIVYAQEALRETTLRIADEFIGPMTGLLGLRTTYFGFKTPGPRDDQERGSVLKVVVGTVFRLSLFHEMLQPAIKKFRNNTETSWQIVERTLQGIHFFHGGITKGTTMETDDMYDSNGGCPIGMGVQTVTARYRGKSKGNMVIAGHQVDGQVVKKIQRAMIEGSEETPAQSIHTLSTFLSAEKQNFKAIGRGRNMPITGIDQFSGAMVEYMEPVKDTHISLMVDGIEMIYKIVNQNGELKSVDVIEREISQIRSYIQEHSTEIRRIDTSQALTEQNKGAFKEIWDRLGETEDDDSESKQSLYASCLFRYVIESSTDARNGSDTSPGEISSLGAKFLFAEIGIDDIEKQIVNTKGGYGEFIMTIPGEELNLEGSKRRLRAILAGVGLKDKDVATIATIPRILDVLGYAPQGRLPATCGVGSSGDLEIIRAFQEGSDALVLYRQAREQLINRIVNETVFPEDLTAEIIAYRTAFISMLKGNREAYTIAKEGLPLEETTHNGERISAINTTMVTLMRKTSEVFAALPRPVQEIARFVFTFSGKNLQALYAGGEDFIADLERMDLSQPKERTSDALFLALYRARRIPVELEKVFAGTSVYSAVPNGTVDSPEHRGIAVTTGMDSKAGQIMATITEQELDPDPSWKLSPLQYLQVLKSRGGLELTAAERPHEMQRTRLITVKTADGKSLKFTEPNVTITVRGTLGTQLPEAMNLVLDADLLNFALDPTVANQKVVQNRARTLNAAERIMANTK